MIFAKNVFYLNAFVNRDIAEQETKESKQILKNACGIEDLGVWLPPDASPAVR